jgi:hypothetical protein
VTQAGDAGECEIAFDLGGLVVTCVSLLLLECYLASTKGRNTCASSQKLCRQVYHALYYGMFVAMLQPADKRFNHGDGRFSICEVHTSALYLLRYM